MNVLCFHCVASVWGHEVVHITSILLFPNVRIAWSAFNKTTEIESRPALYRKKLAPGGFPVNTSEP